MKRILTALFILACTPFLVSMGKSTGPTLTWLVEGEEIDGPKMVRRDVQAAPDGKVHFFRITPMVTHRDVRGMIPMPAEDGTWGATFILNENGWRNIQAAAAMDGGRLIRVYVNGRPVEFQRVAKPTSDDHQIVIWRGITDGEMNQLKSKYKDPTAQAKGKKR